MSKQDLETAVVFDGLKGIFKFLVATETSEEDFIKLLLPHVMNIQTSLTQQEVEKASQRLQSMGLESAGCDVVGVQPGYQQEGIGIRSIKRYIRDFRDREELEEKEIEEHKRKIQKIDLELSESSTPLPGLQSWRNKRARDLVTLQELKKVRAKRKQMFTE